jgi:hypothetical protein
LADAKEDLAIIRRIASHSNEGGIYGGVNTQGRELPGELKVSLARNGREVEQLKVVTEAGGWEIYGLRPGTYLLSITLDEHVIFLRRAIPIHARSCEDVGVLGFPPLNEP